MSQPFETVTTDSWRVRVDGVDAIIAADHTWKDIYDLDVLKRTLDQRASAGQNGVRLWQWPEAQGPLSPRPYSQAAANLMRLACNEAWDRGMVPMPMIETWYDVDGRQPGGGREWGDPTSAEIAWINRLLNTLSGIPYILEISNEVPPEGYAWQEAMIREARRRTGQPIIVNGNAGANELALRQSGADGYATGKNPTFKKSHGLVGIYDTDHDTNVLQSRSAGAKIDRMQQALDRGQRIILHMRAYEGSVLNAPYSKPVNDPRNPSNQGVEEYLGEIATPLGGSIPGPPDPPDPPGPPDPPPPPGEWITSRAAIFDMKDIYYNRRKYPELTTPGSRNAAVKPVLASVVIPDYRIREAKAMMYNRKKYPGLVTPSLRNIEIRKVLTWPAIP